MQKIPEIDIDDQPMDTDFNTSVRSLSTNKVSQVFGKMNRIEEELENLEDANEQDKEAEEEMRGESEQEQSKFPSANFATIPNEEDSEKKNIDFITKYCKNTHFCFFNHFSGSQKRRKMLFDSFQNKQEPELEIKDSKLRLPKRLKYHKQTLDLDFKNKTVQKYLGQNRTSEMFKDEMECDRRPFINKRLLRRVNSTLSKNKFTDPPRPSSSNIVVRSLLGGYQQANERKTRLIQFRNAMIDFENLQDQRKVLQHKVELETMKEVQRGIITPENVKSLMKSRAKRKFVELKRLKKAIEYDYYDAIQVGKKRGRSKRSKSKRGKSKNLKKKKLKSKKFRVLKSRPSSILDRRESGYVYNHKIEAGGFVSKKDKS